jgi:hypothetical protein
MKKKGLLVALIALLVAEAVLIVLLPAKIPRAMRALTAATNLIAAAVVWLAIRQRKGSGRQL